MSVLTAVHRTTAVASPAGALVLALTLVACRSASSHDAAAHGSGSATTTAATGPVSVAALAPSAPSSAVPAWEAACRETATKRFHPPAAWFAVSNVGPADRSPYADCKAWIDGTPPPPKATPMDCGDARGGWAGIGTAQSMWAAALSKDGALLMRCEGACTFSRVDDGKVVAKVPSPDIDGMPVADKAPVKNLAKKLGFDLGAKHAWPLDEAFLDWSLSPKGSAVTFYLRDRATPTKVPIGRFTSREDYLFPDGASWSGNGRMLLLTAWERPSSQGISLRDAVVDLPAARARLALDVLGVRRDEETSARAETACKALDASAAPLHP